MGYIENIYIGQNVRITYDLLIHFDENDIEAYLTQINFEKAFDSEEWPILMKCLKTSGFEDHFLKWITILYTDIKACVGNNCYYSNYNSLSQFDKAAPFPVVNAVG